MNKKVRTKVIKINGIKTTVIIPNGKKSKDIPNVINSYKRRNKQW